VKLSLVESLHSSKDTDSKILKNSDSSSDFNTERNLKTA